MRKSSRRLRLNAETIKALTEVDLGRVGGAIGTANISAENVSCCSFEAACPTDGCPTRFGSCRMC